MSDVTTRGVRVQVRSVYVPERSDPDAGHYFFAYRVRISNVGTDVVQLVTRHWVITNADGRTEEVRGPGVVGETPVLAAGDAFEYTSACPLDTPVGSMHGSYQMVYTERDEPGFDAVIQPFTLAVPGTLH